MICTLIIQLIDVSVFAETMNATAAALATHAARTTAPAAVPAAVPAAAPAASPAAAPAAAAPNPPVDRLWHVGAVPGGHADERAGGHGVHHGSGGAPGRVHQAGTCMYACIRTHIPT